MIWAHCWRGQSITMGRHGGGRRLLALVWVDWVADRTNAGTWLASFPTLGLLFFLQSRTPAHRRVQPILRVGLPSSAEPPWKCLHRQTQSYVSLVIINADEVTVKTGHHIPKRHAHP